MWNPCEMYKVYLLQPVGIYPAVVVESASVETMKNVENGNEALSVINMLIDCFGKLYKCKITHHTL